MNNPRTEHSISGVTHALAGHKAAPHLLPILCLVYFMAYVDRTGTGLAKTALKVDVDISTAANAGPYRSGLAEGAGSATGSFAVLGGGSIVGVVLVLWLWGRVRWEGRVS